MNDVSTGHEPDPSNLTQQLNDAIAQARLSPELAFDFPGSMLPTADISHVSNESAPWIGL